MTKLGIVITEHSYERIPYLIDCLHGLKNQTFKDFHAVIVDDSNGNRISPIVEFMSRFGQIPSVIRDDKKYSGFLKYPKDNTNTNFYHIIDPKFSTAGDYKLDFRLTYIKNPSNYGASKSCNVGIDFLIKECGCDIIALHDGDDVSMPYRLEMQLKTILAHDLNACSGDKLEFGLGHLGRQSKFHPDPNSIRCQAAFWGSAFYKTNSMFKASILQELPEGKLFDDSYIGVGDDIVMNARFAKVGKLALIPQILTYYRRHTSNLSITEESNNRFQSEYSRSIKQILSMGCGAGDLGDDFYKKYYYNYHLQQFTKDADVFFDQTREVFLQCKYVEGYMVSQIVDTLIDDFRKKRTAYSSRILGLDKEYNDMIKGLNL